MKQIDCPFCGKPSIIAHDGQFFCFSCGMGGDRVSYIRALKNVSYKNAADLLNVELLTEESRQDDVRDVLNALKEAEDFYFHSSAAVKKAYFEKRKLKQETVDAFRLGYAEGNKKLYSFLLKKGVTENVMEKAGLLYVTEDGKKLEKFWKRIIFPIHDENGNTIGFGARVLGDQKPKYMNSAESVVFDKSHNLYALDIAKKSNEDFFFLCEGYVDVISMHQHGFTNAIASLGTAFTVGHAELLHKYKSKVYVVYDSDEAGQKATTKAIDILLKEGIEVKVVSVAPYKDVDALLVSEGKIEFDKRIDAAIDGKKFLLKGKTPKEIVDWVMTEF